MSETSKRPVAARLGRLVLHAALLWLVNFVGGLVLLLIFSTQPSIEMMLFASALNVIAFAFFAAFAKGHAFLHVIGVALLFWAAEIPLHGAGAPEGFSPDLAFRLKRVAILVAQAVVGFGIWYVWQAGRDDPDEAVGEPS